MAYVVAMLLSTAFFCAVVVLVAVIRRRRGPAIAFGSVALGCVVVSIWLSLAPR